MSKKPKADRSDIVHAYVKYVLKKGHAPASVYTFCKKLGLEEPEFYQIFPSLEAVASATWVDTLHQTLEVVEADEEFAHYAFREKLLAFLYTYLEQALEQRSYMLLTWPGPRPQERVLRNISCAYRSIVQPWLTQAIGDGSIASRGSGNRLYAPVFAVHLIGVIDYWLKDESTGFERTDAFVDKTVTLAMDLLRKQAVDSAVDFARFMAGEGR